MNLRIRFAFWFAVFVAIILSLACAIIYTQSADFRQDEFFNRLEQKARTTQRFWFDVQEIDSTLLKIIDRNDMTTLFQEQVLMFNPEDRLMYSSVDNDSVQYDKGFLERVRVEKKVLHSDEKTGVESVGLLIKRGNEDYAVLASAYDLYGFRKLSNLFSILIFTWLAGLGMTVLLAYLYVRNIVGKPLAGLTSQIAQIGENELAKRLKVPENQNELTILAQDFNILLDRVQKAFESQRSFVQYASHELRTPLANMLSETEHALSMDRDPEFYRRTLHSLREEQSRLVEMTNALLLLSRYQYVKMDMELPL
ncbi:MAG: HAMP domain-containing protein, partial [Saprospiraceae bacterium]|nr:HAMP domain-containing protein [Saprospiraceae bacterium]